MGTSYGEVAESRGFVSGEIAKSWEQVTGKHLSFRD
jgi:hypothetical protein